MGKYYVYILHSAKLNRFYTGSTSDIITRMEFHHNPETRKFTAKAQDWELFENIECERKFFFLILSRFPKPLDLLLLFLLKLRPETLLKY